jgi:hypothetical protein
MKVKHVLFFVLLIAAVGVVQSQVVDPTLVKTYMKFDGNIDDSSNNPVTYAHHTTSQGINYADGKFGQAGVFNMTAMLSEGLGFDPINPFTIAAWINMNQLPSERDNPTVGQAMTWIHQLDGGAAPGRIHLEVTNTNYIGNFSGGNPRLDNTDVIEVNTWYHVAIVNNPTSGFISLYIDGVKKNEVTAPTETTNTEVVLGGRKQVPIDGNNDQLRFRAAGMMDELLITHQPLSEQDVNYIKTNGVASALQPSSARDIAANEFRAYHWNGSLNAHFGSELNNANYAVYSITGQRILDGVMNGNQLTVDAPLAKGVYILNVNAGNNPFTAKFIVR